MKSMIKLAKIVNSSCYQKYYNTTVEREKDRIYCCHNLTHFIDMARVAYLLYLTKEVAAPELDCFSPDEVKEIIYTVGYLHDIGRFAEYDDANIDHAQESAKLARPLLQEAGFSVKEQAIIEKAIKNHRKKDGEGFDGLIYLADKKSRPCHSCVALNTCKKFPKGKIADNYFEVLL